MGTMELSAWRLPRMANNPARDSWFFSRRAMRNRLILHLKTAAQYLCFAVDKKLSAFTLCQPF
jgi:hypothetical protein